MPTIDADAHVIENERTWSYLTEGDLKFKPKRLLQIEGEFARSNRGSDSKEWWMFDKNFQPADRNINEKETASESREMTNVGRRLEHMDELKIDIQILYPTIFLNPCYDDPAGELALYRSYNRWLADIWKQAPARLRWAAMIPLHSMHRAREEMIFCKEHGAVSVFLRPFECERMVFDSYFFPLYEMVQELDLAITFHSGNGSPHNRRFLWPHNFAIFKMSMVNCFHGLIEGGVPDRFPGVRWGIIEGGAGWIPWALSDLEKRFRRRGKRVGPEPLKSNNIFVTVELSDNIASVIDCVGDDNLVVGTDYGHTDTSAEIEALRLLGESGTVTKASAAKILGPNSAQLYNL